MFNTIFLPTFLKTFAVTCGIGGGILAVLTITAVVLIVTSPIINKIQK